MMSHIDLCSGIGGFALGFEWAGLSKPIMFCDIEPWSRKILAKHWPDVPIAEDVKELANDPDGLIPDTDPRNTILTSGYPCQPWSLASNKRLGTEDTRHIYPYISRIIAQKRPAWVVLENVYGHLSLGLDEVLNDLESKEYSTRTFILPSGAIVGAPHKRDRLWIMAYTSRVGYRGRTGQECRTAERFVFSEEQGRSTVGSEAKRCGALFGTGQGWEFEPTVGRVAHGIPRRVDRLKGLGNAIVPQIAQKIGEVIKAQHDRN